MFYSIYLDKTISCDQGALPIMRTTRLHETLSRLYGVGSVVAKKRDAGAESSSVIIFAALDILWSHLVKRQILQVFFSSFFNYVAWDRPKLSDRCSCATNWIICIHQRLGQRCHKLKSLNAFPFPQLSLKTLKKKKKARTQRKKKVV